jgi:alkaline phosphatase D
MKKVIVLLLASVLSVSTFAQVKSGPMLGYSEMREVMLWVQTEKAAKVQFKYFDKTEPSRIISTETVASMPENEFIVKIIAKDVLPSKVYGYEVWIDKKKVNFDYPLEFKTQTLWQYRTDPPAFKFAFGSCTYTNEERFDRPGKPYGGDFSIFTKIYENKPDFMVWGGDNIYLREPDWNSRTGIYHRYNEFKKVKELQPLWANTHHYAIWDDHDFGNNDADRSFWNKNITLEAFKAHWGNPNYIFENEGITGTFFWEDCQFFLLDDRYFRAPNYLTEEGKDYFGKKQEDWVIDALASSTAPFKFVVTGGQVINPAKVFENMSNYEQARERFLKRIHDNAISGVIFLTGDRHHTNLQKLEREGTYPLYEATISPLTSGAGKPVEQESISPIVKGTEVNEKQNFSIWEVSGKRTERELTINVFDKVGEKLWSQTIKAKELKAPRKKAD